MTHALLTPAAVLHIATHRPPRMRRSYALSLRLSRQFRVSQRAIRDVWNRRTWASLTAGVHEEGDDLGWLVRTDDSCI